MLRFFLSIKNGLMSYDPSFKYHPTIKKNTFLCQKYCNDQFRVWRENGSWEKIPISNQTF
jgi:hypothetical protein